NQSKIKNLSYIPPDYTILVAFLVVPFRIPAQKITGLRFHDILEPQEGGKGRKTRESGVSAGASVLNPR
ncbi:MAG: hypothetical protein IIZ03_08510, partial [Succinivibrionaceae bacterium]|nr:hypothetical protein [Succinivibrionaceae bacterium]